MSNREILNKYKQTALYGLLKTLPKDLLLSKDNLRSLIEKRLQYFTKSIKNAYENTEKNKKSKLEDLLEKGCEQAVEDSSFPNFLNFANPVSNVWNAFINKGVEYLVLPDNKKKLQPKSNNEEKE